MKKNMTEMQLANLTTAEGLQGHKRSLKHGLYSPRTLAKKQEEIKRRIMELPYIKGQDGILVDNLAFTLSIKELIYEYLGENGLFKVWPKSEVQPVLKQLWPCLKEMRMIAGALGLTPRDRVKLGIDIARAADFAKAMQDVNEDKEKDK